jgi:hypothetical protein
MILRMEILPLIALGLALAFSAACADELTPVLRLEKEEYVLGESVRFFVGVHGKMPVPKALQKPGVLKVTIPSGMTYTETIGWPCDGMVDATWEGGWGFGERKVEEGTYTLIFEMNGIATSPVKLVVKKFPLLEKIVSSFQFSGSGEVEQGSDREVTFRVTNNSAETIIFNALDGPESPVRVSWRDLEKQVDGSAIYDPKKIAIPKPTDIQEIARRATNRIELHPGKEYIQKLSLKDANVLAYAQTISVTFETTLQIRVGEKDGPYAKMCPIRLAISGSKKFIGTGKAAEK